MEPTTAAPPADLLTFIGNVTGVLFFGLLVFAFVHTRYERHWRRILRESGIRINAQVTKLETRMIKDDLGGPPGYAYFVTYQFKSNWITYSRRQSVERAVYEPLREGGTVAIMYLPEKPAQSRVANALQVSLQ